MGNRKSIKLKSDETLEKQLVDAKSDKEARAIRKQMQKEITKELRARKRRKREAGKRFYDESPDVRTEEQIKHSKETVEEIAEFLDDKYVISKFGNRMYPKIVWCRDKKNLDGQPYEGVKVIEREFVREVVKPNKTFYTYMEERDPVPEEVILTGYKHILSEYGIDKLDDYEIRKLLYHTLLSIAHYLDINENFYIALEDMHIIKEPLKRSVFSIIIPQSSACNKRTTVSSLYDYFVGGGMDIEALNKTLDIFALSFIEYTESKKSLRDKARDSYNRYRLLQEQVDQAKAMLRAQGINSGKNYKKALEEIVTQLKKEHKDKFSKNTNKKYLTNDNSCGIIEEDREDTEEHS